MTRIDEKALPATAPYVDRMIRIFRDHPSDDTSALVLRDYARAALEPAPAEAEGWRHAPTPTELNQIGMTLNFLASVIKSGEPWTATCQREFDAAHACVSQVRAALPPAPAEAAKVKALEDWHEDDGYCVWWTWQDGQWLGEPSYIGSPLCDDWPDYHTHWSPHPSFPPAPAGKE